jgi:hypothetical protein
MLEMDARRTADVHEVGVLEFQHRPDARVSARDGVLVAERLKPLLIDVNRRNRIDFRQIGDCFNVRLGDVAGAYDRCPKS